MGHHRYMSTVVAILVQHRCSTDTALDTTRYVGCHSISYCYLLLCAALEKGGQSNIAFSRTLQLLHQMIVTIMLLSNNNRGSALHYW